MPVQLINQWEIKRELKKPKIKKKTSKGWYNNIVACFEAWLKFISHTKDRIKSSCKTSHKIFLKTAILQFKRYSDQNYFSNRILKKDWWWVLLLKQPRLDLFSKTNHKGKESPFNEICSSTRKLWRVFCWTQTRFQDYSKSKQKFDKKRASSEKKIAFC